MRLLLVACSNAVDDHHVSESQYATDYKSCLLPPVTDVSASPGLPTLFLALLQTLWMRNRRYEWMDGVAVDESED